MELVRLSRAARRAVALAVVGLPVLAGCGAAAGSPDPGASVAVLRIDVPVHELRWSYKTTSILALAGDDHHVVKVDVSGPAPRTTVSAPFEDVGENISTSPTDEQHAVGSISGELTMYLPQPRLGRVAVLAVRDLRQVGTLQAGPSPSYVDKDSASKTLLALSEDGSTVTGVDLYDGKVVTSKVVNAGPDAEVDGGKRGRRIDYHVAGARGVAYYKGNPYSVDKQGEVGISAEKTTSDSVKSSRVYVAEKGTDRLIAADAKRSLTGLEVVGHADAGEPVHYLGVDELRLYAATEHKLLVFQTNSYEGYQDERIPLLTTIDFRAALPSELRDAPLSGLTVGTDRVYLSFEGRPYLVSIAKPDV